MGHYIFSTLTCDNAYNLYHPRLHDKAPNRIARSVVIKGGANVSDKKFRITSPGVMTKVTDEELELLKNNVVFKRHVERGFLIIENKKVEVEKASSKMTKKDRSAPKVPEDYPRYVETKRDNNQEDVTMSAKEFV